MINGKRVLAIIPARGGSKRLPKKNIRLLGGKPLIGWTICAAKESKYIDEVIVSTDDKEIANIASQFGVSPPELRPVELSTDSATTESVVFYTLNKFGKDASIVILLQPTSPFRNNHHIDEAIELLEEKAAYSIVSVTECEHPPQCANFLPENNSMRNFIRQENNKRSQDIGISYRINGAIYVFDIIKLLNVGFFSYNENCYAYKMGKNFSVDIDCQMDFDFAEFLYQNDQYS